jgi:prepilin-type N-terminal cleavage/methylation domain-containing protein/prepilin-type processing-associated H-X9-DG protein
MSETTNRAALRCGLTLVELLVVVAIIGILIAITVPAIQMTREAANRAQCQANLRMIGIALHGFHSTKGSFPSGINLKQSPQFLGWGATILPYLEQHTLSKEITSAFLQHPDFRAIPPHVHRGTVVAMFGCPTDARTMANARHLFRFPIAFTAYLGVSGTDLEHRDGVLFPDSSISFANITDGTSNTLMVGERPPSHDLKLGWWYAGWGQDGAGSAEMVLGVQEKKVTPNYPGCPAGPYAFQSGSIDNACDAFRFWSLHRGGAHFLFADGSVRFVAYNAVSIMPALATRAGGEAGLSF